MDAIPRAMIEIIENSVGYRGMPDVPKASIKYLLVVEFH